jgi:hypothetical protein
MTDLEKVEKLLDGYLTILDKENKYTKERSEGQIFIINEIQKFIDNLKKL